MKDKFILPNDVSRCSNPNCTLKDNCKRAVQHHNKDERYLFTSFNQEKDGSCNTQIKFK